MRNSEVVGSFQIAVVSCLRLMKNACYKLDPWIKILDNTQSTMDHFRFIDIIQKNTKCCILNVELDVHIH